MVRRIRPAAAAALLFLGIGISPGIVAQTVVRGPYLQSATPTSLVVRWRTDQSVDGVVRYGTSPSNLNLSAVGATGTEHEVALSGLEPEMRYYYSVGSSSGALAGDESYTFATGPLNGESRSTRIWIVGDSGEANDAARDVRDSFKSFTGGRGMDLWLMLGDNAYDDGTDSEYQAAVFEMYPTLLRQSPVWPTLGNHDAKSADSASQSGVYYDIFTLPKNGEAGGIASGTEAYYSFDYANIHFVVLDSQDSDRSVDGTMLSWLENDLAANQQDWLIAFWHHPPYSKGSHDSDSESKLTDMRENALPLLESYGVDLVLAGHSHGYERSFLIDGHYGHSSTFDASMQLDSGSGREDDTGAYSKSAPGVIHAGAVYAVAGSSSKASSSGSMNHPVMFLSLKMLGSMVLDVDGLRLHGQFLDDAGDVLDYFTMRKDGSGPSDLQAPSSPENLHATEVSENSVSLQWTPATDNVGVTGYRVSRNGATVSTVAGTSFDDSGLEASTSYTYGVKARDAAGNESAEVTIDIVTSERAPDSEPPGSPRNLRITDVTTSSVSLRWDAATDNVGVTGYRVFRSGELLATVDELDFSDGGLAAGTNYTYGVEARDAAGNTSPAATISVITDEEVPEPEPEPEPDPAPEPEPVSEPEPEPRGGGQSSGGDDGGSVDTGGGSDTGGGNDTSSSASGGGATGVGSISGAPVSDEEDGGIGAIDWLLLALLAAFFPVQRRRSLR